MCRGAWSIASQTIAFLVCLNNIARMLVSFLYCFFFVFSSSKCCLFKKKIKELYTKISTALLLLMDILNTAHTLNMYIYIFFLRRQKWSLAKYARNELKKNIVLLHFFLTLHFVAHVFDSIYQVNKYIKYKPKLKICL